MEMPLETVNMQYLPDPEELESVKNVGKKLGELIININYLSKKLIYGDIKIITEIKEG